MQLNENQYVNTYNTKHIMYVNSGESMGKIHLELISMRL